VLSERHIRGSDLREGILFQGSLPEAQRIPVKDGIAPLSLSPLAPSLREIWGFLGGGAQVKVALLLSPNVLLPRSARLPDAHLSERV